ncbi:LysR family transcriptional regulator [Ralstonia solanacearum]|uniref:LysR family transcriptional regulator n=1 Tax=Ralstonia solanacearum TaxID=305 RepID=UPI00078C333E|nr:LysR family transcriptional regulator [Ralstonia solanacearum]AMP39322.1 LysR family transcriptional regulator [Ralstonia solanacearum]AXV88158.1 LysR family transcriptional regulator [Ralstonia solanacearum]AXW07643.1 LysR family transcriptional regulator [Ralstonia solanacearum]AXW25433.1 LysR family transcriptional regulator [Ralstonia solanacearum]AXW82345.1 LysR family transcriptional regulator [Ralstonia solanacearum]
MLRAGLSELTAFIAIAEQRTFRAAAGVLGVSPSALSHAMRNLEARLGVRLLNRTTRSVALTEAGEQLLRRVRPAVADLEDAVNEVASERNRPSGSIRISASENAARPLVRHVLPDFLAAYPDIHVECVVDTRLVDIVADGFDAGIRLLEDVPRDMIAVRFGPDMRFVAVASPAYLSRHAPPEMPHDLTQHRCIRFRFESGALYRWDLERRGTAASINVDGPLTLGNLNLMVEAALAGIGIAWVPENLVAEPVAAGRLVHLLPEWSPSLSGLCLYYPANRHPPTALRLFAQAVREWAERNLA